MLRIDTVHSELTSSKGAFIRFRLAAFALVLVAAACTTTPTATTETSSPESSTTTLAIVNTTASARPDLDRLVVLGDDGNVYTMARDGTDRVDLTSDAGAEARYFQPIWSPLGDRIAVSEARSDGTISMSTIDAETGNVSRSEAASLPFYYYWAPDGRRLVYLSGGGELTLTLIEPGTEGTVIGSGQPFYFAWHPTADELLVHVGATRLELLSTSGETSPLAAEPGAFQAPSWQNGVQLYVRQDGDLQEMVLDDGVDQTIVTTYTTASFFTLSPDGASVAYRVSEGDESGVISAAFRQATDTLNVFTADAGTTTPISDGVVVGFWWSPDSEKLLFVDLIEGGRLQWHVWDATETVDFPSFIPSPTFARDFLPFFDQYALSMTLWAPDSTAYAFPGIVDSEAGIWVQHLGEAEPTLIGDGVFVGWSPR